MSRTSSRSSSASPAPPPSPYYSLNLSKDGLLARVACIVQFCLGGLVWVRGQAIGSLACTGLGYWVVFDTFGISVGGPRLGRSKGGSGPARTQTTLLFAQCVYLMFAGVYVAKETVEHILLSAGHGHAHGRPSPSPSPPSTVSTASTLALNASLNAAGGITRGLGLHGADLLPVPPRLTFLSANVGGSVFVFEARNSEGDGATEVTRPGGRDDSWTPVVAGMAKRDLMREVFLEQDPHQPLISLFRMMEMANEHPQPLLFTGILLQAILQRIDICITTANRTSALAFELLRGPPPELCKFLHIKFKNGANDDIQT
ncbi:hypothetical protein EV702DRAFT_1051999 [Suillus placidus]|uniref:Uncharacterized protein n=1 Tax=Suillus placidus TaxID=48579 RepID=A0A9P6ZG58_9AGAM|nr:hypothetical protein EV702DRAFT_1051999 [Suillus placidus]